MRSHFTTFTYTVRADTASELEAVSWRAEHWMNGEIDLYRNDQLWASFHARRLTKQEASIALSHCGRTSPAPRRARALKALRLDTWSYAA